MGHTYTPGCITPHPTLTLDGGEVGWDRRDHEGHTHVAVGT
jgi:hypothetical protein